MSERCWAPHFGVVLRHRMRGDTIMLVCPAEHSPTALFVWMTGLYRVTPDFDTEVREYSFPVSEWERIARGDE
jgi:hypothetical protein